jgi:hypothetical protein
MEAEGPHWCLAARVSPVSPWRSDAGDQVLEYMVKSNAHSLLQHSYFPYLRCVISILYKRFPHLNISCIFPYNVDQITPKVMIRIDLTYALR